MNPLDPREPDYFDWEVSPLLTKGEREVIAEIYVRERLAKSFDPYGPDRPFDPYGPNRPPFDLHGPHRPFDLHGPDRLHLTEHEHEVLCQILARERPRTGFFNLLAPRRRLVKPAPRRRLVKPAPGSWLYGFFRFVCSPKTFERVYKPIFADMWDEYHEALKSGDEWKARWIIARTTLQLLTAICLSLGLSLIDKVLKVWRIGG